MVLGWDRRTTGDCLDRAGVDKRFCYLEKPVDSSATICDLERYFYKSPLLFFIFVTYCPIFVGRVAQSVQRLTTGWTVRDRIPVGTRFSASPDRPWGPPSLLYNGYRVFPEGKVRPGRAADHSPPSSAAVMEEQSYTSTHPLGHTGPVTGSLYPYLFTFPYLFLYRSKEFLPVRFFISHSICITVVFWISDGHKGKMDSEELDDFFFSLQNSSPMIKSRSVV